MTLISKHTTEGPDHRILRTLARAGRSHETLALEGLDTDEKDYCTGVSYIASTGAQIWVIEIERFGSPDCQWWDIYQFDAPPSADDVRDRLYQRDTGGNP